MPGFVARLWSRLVPLLQQLKAPCRRGAWFLLFAGALGGNPAGAEKIQPGEASQPLDSGISFLVEREPLSLEQVRALPEGRWKPLEGAVNFGYSDRPHWFRIRLENATGQRQRRLLEIAYPLLDKLAFYEVEDGRVVQQAQTGDHQPFRQRPLEHRHFVFPLSVPHNETHEIYFRVQTSGSLQLPMTLWKEQAFYRASEQGTIGRALFYGALLIIAAYNLFLYLALRERAYLYYVMSVLATLGLTASLHGVSFQYLFPEQPVVQEFLILFIVPFTELSFLLFTVSFLDLREGHPRLYRFFQLMMLVCVALMLVPLFVSYGLSTRMSVIAAIPMGLANLWVGFYLWAKGEKNARFFSLAWVSLLVGGLLTALNRLGLLPTLFITEHGIPLGASFQVLLFAFALADRFNREKEARFRAQQASLDALRHQREAEDQLYRAASHHELTGLPNRTLFERVVQQRLDSREHREIGVVLLHLRRFDDVNKTLGHHTADDLLVQLAQRLNAAMLKEPAVIRIEDDETAVCAAHVEGVSFAFAIGGSDRGSLVAAVERILAELDKPIEFQELSLDLNFMVGCSFADEDSRETATLLRQAFIAFDQADRESGGLAVYEPAMNPYSPWRLTLMTELRAAIERDALSLHFQPQIHLASGRVAGFEALLRWTHPEHGFIPPDEFIPLAEQTGLIKPVTRWVILRALDFCRALDEVGSDAIVAVNISAVNLREKGFAEQVNRLLADNHVAAQRLALEVTETAAMVDPKSALNVLRALQSSKVRLSIDDFGTGHSSLSYIRKLPVQEIKIDRSFVMEMDRNQGDATIVRTTVNMCHDLGFEVVAEGVESESIVGLLRNLGCDLMQGYHIARPMPPEQAIEWLQSCEWKIRA